MIGEKAFKLVVAFVFVSNFATAQLPDPTGATDWDYCECTDGVQEETDLCPCPQTFPPDPGGGNGSTPPTGGNPTPGGGTTDPPNTTIDWCRWFPWWAGC